MQHQSQNGAGSATEIGNPLTTAIPAGWCEQCSALVTPVFLAPFDEEEDRPLELEEVPPEKRTYELFDLCDECLEQREQKRRLDRWIESAGEHLRVRLLGVDHLADLEPPAWLVDGVVPEGDVVLFGQPGALKSFLALDLALCVASGLDWHGHPVKPGPVVYVAGEGVRGMKARVDAWQQAHGQADLSWIFFVPSAVNLLEAGETDRFRNALEMLQPRPVLVVIDTLARSMVGGDENSAKDVGLFLQALSGLPAATRLVVHHSAKDGERERGSTALRGAADMMARIDRDGRQIDLICAKPPKDGEAWATMTFERELVAESLVLKPVPVFQAKIEAAAKCRVAVEAFVREHGPTSRSKVEKGVKGYRPAAVATALDTLVTIGAVTETRTGSKRRTRLYAVAA